MNESRIKFITGGMPIYLKVIGLVCEQRCFWVMTSNDIVGDLFHFNRQLNEFTCNILNPNKWWISDQKNHAFSVF